MYELNKQAFGAFLAQLRREKGYTQKDLAEKLYVSDKAVSKWERGLSVPDVALLVPLAEYLGVTVTELLEGRRLDSAALAPSEVEHIVQKAIAYPEERENTAQQMKRRIQKHLLPFVVCTAAGLIASILLWKLIPVMEVHLKTLLFVSEGLGILFGAYVAFFMDETLPRYYDENRINNVAQYGFRINCPGVYFNNNNWKRVLKTLRIWSMSTVVLMPPLCALASWCEAKFGVTLFWMGLLLIYLTTLFLPLVYVARKYEFVPMPEE